MNQPILDKQISSLTTHKVSGQPHVLTMIVVAGQTFLVYTTADTSTANTPFVGRLGGRKSFISAEQERQLRQALSPFFADKDKSGVSLKAEDLLVQLNDLDLIAISRSGLASKEMAALAERLELSGKEIARLLTLSPRTYHRRKLEEILDPVASERLLLLTKLADHGYDVFENQHKFNQWLRQSLRILGQQAPLDILDTSQGIKLIDTLLGRIEYGVYS